MRHDANGRNRSARQTQCTGGSVCRQPFENQWNPSDSQRRPSTGSRTQDRSVRREVIAAKFGFVLISVGYVAVRQCPLELLYAFVRGLCAAEFQVFKLSQGSEVYQSGVRDLRVRQV